MNTQEIAQKLCAHCEAQTEAQALDELYAPDAISTEPMSPPGVDPVSNGVEAIKGKHEWWANNFEVHSTSFEGPYVNGDKFSMIFKMDVTDKSNGQRWQGDEIALYEVEGGKIVRETFFMKPMG